jgi:hypothetical protein
VVCIPCLEVRLAQPDTLLGFHDPGQPWEQWGCPIKGCGRWFLGPWDLEGHTGAEHPGLDGHLRAAAALSADSGEPGQRRRTAPSLPAHWPTVTLSNENALSRSGHADIRKRRSAGRSGPLTGPARDPQAAPAPT